MSRYFHVNALGSLSLATDAAGDQLNDQVENYQYDAEGRAKSSTCISGCGSQYVTYNALGQRGQDYQTDYLGGYMTLTYPRDIFGDRTGIWDDRPSQNWLGWDIFWARVAGQRLNMGGASAYIDHADAVGSTTMETDPSGAVDWDVVNGPWGQVWQQTGTRQSEVFAGMDWQVNDPLMPSATREYSDGLGRWMTPDPGGVKVVRLDNPQTWNMYAYVTDNPTTLSDPSGLSLPKKPVSNSSGPCFKAVISFIGLPAAISCLSLRSFWSQFNSGPPWSGSASWRSPGSKSLRSAILPITG